MITINPQYIKDASGNSLVVLYQKDFEKLIEELEELEDIRLYDEAKQNDSGDRILLSEYIKIRKEKNG